MTEFLTTGFDSPLLWALLAVQIAMGGFDIIVHHELTERLAWRHSASKELQLHAWRNLFYAVLFTAFAWLQPHGLIAAAVFIILIVEIIITLWDFVEEDRTRKLPATERVLHTLLAINYGAILALVLPALAKWAALPTALTVVNYGWGSAILTMAGVGCVLFAVRDFFTSARAARFTSPPALNLEGPAMAACHARRQILVTGGTGFVGRRLVDALVTAGHDVTVLTRDPGKAGGLTAPVRLVTDLAALDAETRIDAIVDLAGEPLADGLWTDAKRQEILQSRMAIGSAINDLCARLTRAPEVLVTASAVGVYGLQAGDATLTEAEPGPGDDSFCAPVCRAREACAAGAQAHGVRTVALRIGLVLDRDDGLLGRLVPAFDLGLGGPIGSGEQWMSWITRDDLVRLIAFVIAKPGIAGPVNAVAPEPVRQRTFARQLARQLHRPAVVPLPARPLALLGGAFAQELLLGGQRVVPAKALAAGFTFQAPTIDEGLRNALRLGAKPERPAGDAGTARELTPARAALR